MSYSYIVKNLLICHTVQMICDNKKCHNQILKIMHNRTPWPETINDAAERIISIMDEKEKKKVQSIPEDKLEKLYFGLGMYVRNELGLHEGNDVLMKACAISEHGDFESLFFLNDTDSASRVILEEIWNRLNPITIET
jgi:hypothetical protein